MTARQSRRAAERRTSEQARNAAPSQTPELPVQVSELPLQNPERNDARQPTPRTISPAQLNANRANSQLSTGPKSSEGKAKSCLNAVKTGLTGRTVLLPSEDAEAYQQHVEDWFQELRPVGVREAALAQSLADNSWRVLRIPALEMGIYAFGRIQFANQFDQEALSLRPGLIELHTFLAYEKQLRNLQLQFARLHRQSEKDTAELRRLQEERRRKEKENLETAAQLYLAAKQQKQPFDPARHGFEFSTMEIESFLERMSALNAAKPSLKQDSERSKFYSNAA
jgi:hypothetical protein